MVFVVLYKYLKPAIDALTVTINYKIILLMLFITPWCKPLKTDLSRELCTMPLD